VIVAVVAVRVVQVAAHDVVGVIPVRNRLVTAPRPVDVPGGVPAAVVRRCTTGRVGGGDIQVVLVHMVAVRVVQVAVVQVVGVAVVLDGGVPAPRPVLMVVVVVLLAGGHWRASDERGGVNRTERDREPVASALLVKETDSCP
jgi:hypothetical protein